MSDKGFDAIAERSAPIGLRLYRDDIIVLSLVGSLLGLSLLFHAMLGRLVNWEQLAPPILASFGMMALGAVLRLSGSRFQSHATGAIAVGAFTASVTLNLIFALQLFPLTNPVIDDALARMDAWFGHDWETLMLLLGRYPAIGNLLGWVYQSFFLQMATVVCLLAVTSRRERLYSFLIVSQVSLYITLAIWWLWPSLGPAAYVTLPAELERSIGLVYGAEQGRILRQLAAEGVPMIDYSVMIGTIAFPSYHMLMACAVIWYLRGTWLFLPALLLNILMVPATVSHGGHHVVDLIGGAALFAAVATGVGWAYRRGVAKG